MFEVAGKLGFPRWRESISTIRATSSAHFALLAGLRCRLCSYFDLLGMYIYAALFDSSNSRDSSSLGLLEYVLCRNYHELRQNIRPWLSVPRGFLYSILYCPLSVNIQPFRQPLLGDLIICLFQVPKVQLHLLLTT